MPELLQRLQDALGGAYRLERELGGGGMSRVFLATETALGRRVVIKVLPPDLAAGVNVERFRREIVLAASLQHPHIVPLLAAGDAGGLLFFTMPYVEGESLRARLERGAPITATEAVRILRDVADALAYAHRRGVVHRDIKPENVLLAEQHALVTDFGVAKALGSSAAAGTLTSAGIALGTPMYMAPEQAAGDPKVDHRCDVYATGALGYELLTGRAPFQAESPQRVIAALLTEPPQPIHQVKSGVPAALEAAVMRCLEKEPGSRFQTADELLATLEGAAGAPASPVHGPRIRRRTVAAAASVLVIAAAVVAGLAVMRRSSPPTGSGNLVAVLPFTVRGGPELAYLGPGMVNLLSTSLDGAGDLRSVDPRAVLTLFPQGGAPTPDPSSGAAAARRLGAGRFVLGDIVQGGGQVRIEAAMYEPSRLSAPLAQGSVEGARGDVFALVDGLAAKLLAATSGPAARVTRIAAVTTSSLPALKAYLDGDAAFRRGQADSALIAFQTAIAADTGFALAYYRLSVAAEWATRGALATASANEAVKRSAHLSEHDRLLLEALQVTRRGAGQEAERAYRAIIGSYPDDVEAWTNLGEVLFHYAPFEGRSIAESRSAWEKVLYLDPDNDGAMLHLARVAALEGHTAEVDSLTARLIRVTPGGDRNLEVLALRAAVDRDRAAEERVLGQLRGAPDLSVSLATWDIALFVQDLDVAARLARLLTDPARSEAAQATGHLLLAHFALARGQLGAARQEIALASAADSVYALEYGTLMDLAPFLTTPADKLERERGMLERLDAAAVSAAAALNVFLSPLDGLHASVRAYLLGLLAARRGAAAAAERYAAELEAQRGPQIAHALPQDYALEVRAEIARAGGDDARAASLLGRRVAEVWYEYPIASPFLSGARARYLQAEQASRAGDTRRALELYNSFTGGEFDLVYLAPARFRRGQLYERLGDNAAAAADYRTVADLWKDADPVFKPVADSARAALVRLRSQ